MDNADACRGGALFPGSGHSFRSFSNGAAEPRSKSRDSQVEDARIIDGCSAVAQRGIYDRRAFYRSAGVNVRRILESFPRLQCTRPVFFGLVHCLSPPLLSGPVFWAVLTRAETSVSCTVAGRRSLFLPLVRPYLSLSRSCSLSYTSVSCVYFPRRFYRPVPLWARVRPGRSERTHADDKTI